MVGTFCKTRIILTEIIKKLMISAVFCTNPDLQIGRFCRPRTPIIPLTMRKCRLVIILSVTGSSWTLSFGFSDPGPVRFRQRWLTLCWMWQALQLRVFILQWRWHPTARRLDGCDRLCNPKGCHSAVHLQWIYSGDTILLSQFVVATLHLQWRRHSSDAHSLLLYVEGF